MPGARSRVQPLPIRRPWRRAIREGWSAADARRGIWLAALAALIVVVWRWTTLDPIYRPALGSVVCAASVTAVVDALLVVDRRHLTRLHDASGLPAVAGGWRIRPEMATQEDLDAVSCLAWFYANAHLERRRIRGHPRGGNRWSYAGGGLRAEARRWAAANGRPVRHGDRTIGYLRDLRVLRAVRISQVDALRLAYPTAEDAIRAYERMCGRFFVAWELAPDPRLRP